MIIRKMHRDDLSACAQILQRVYNNELWKARWTQETAEAYLADFFDMRKFVGYVIVDQGEFIGAIFAREKVWWNNSEIFVEEMFVRPDMQGKGCGTLLVRQIEAYVREHALAGITLSTNRYAPAAAFYKKLGFADCGHVLFMAKEIRG